MAVKYTCISSLPKLTDTSCIKEKKLCKNHSSNKRDKSYYYICLGALAHTVHMQIENKYVQNDYLYLIGSRYIKELYKWIQLCKDKEVFSNDFKKSLITSVALFALGIKLTSELVAWKVS